MPQQQTNSDRDPGIALFVSSPRMWVNIEPRWWLASKSKFPSRWEAMTGPARRHEIVVTIEYDPTDTGAKNVTVHAVANGLGVRWQLTPADDESRPDERSVVEVHSLDGQPVGQRLLSQLGLGRVHDVVSRALAEPAAAAILGERWGAVVAPKPGRRGRADLFYAQVALEYVRALEVEPETPVRWMLTRADERGETVTGDELRARLRRARARKLLTSAPPGKAGGRLTAKAKRVLREAGLIEEEG